jgi:hypothetical protein
VSSAVGYIELGARGHYRSTNTRDLRRSRVFACDPGEDVSTAMPQFREPNMPNRHDVGQTECAIIDPQRVSQAGS